MTKDIFSDDFFDALDSSTRDVSTAETLPAACYTDAGFFEFEKDAIFAREWLCVGRAEWASGSGDYFTTRIIGEPIIIVRDRDGALRALSAVCQHRAMLVAEGRGATNTFVCPYHKWTYALDGRLIGAPSMERTCDFDKADARLRQFNVEVWMGFVFINLDLEAEPLGPRLAAVAEVIEHWDLTTARGPLPDKAERYPFNWKVMLENNNDGYHANKLHSGPLHDFVPSELAWFPELPADTGGYYRFNGALHADASFNPTQKALMPIFPGLSADERSRVMFANVPPTLSLGFTSDLIMYFILRPDGPETHEMDFGLLFAPGAMAQPHFDLKLDAIKATMTAITVQDLHVDELIQVGLRSRFARRGRYSWQEGAQRLLNCWLVTRYKAAWNSAKRHKVAAPESA
jgi:phenylpropionate dioxygenase-like ring-hydroxylating dioxygenase large terminal subunit